MRYPRVKRCGVVVDRESTKKTVDDPGALCLPANSREE